MSVIQNSKSFGIVFCTFNRLNATRNFIDKICILARYTNIELFCLDDGSTDGTREYLQNHPIGINLITADGNLYWAQGMHRCIDRFKIELSRHDHIILCNDDISLDEENLLGFASFLKNLEFSNTLYVMKFIDSNGFKTYGIRKIVGKSLAFSPILEHSCVDTSVLKVANFNLVIVSNLIFNSVGNISPGYVHGLADFDYSVRVQQSGFQIKYIDGIYGVCENNLQQLKNLSLLESRKKFVSVVRSPKNPSLKELIKFYTQCRIKPPLSIYISSFLKRYFPSVLFFILILSGRKL